MLFVLIAYHGDMPAAGTKTRAGDGRSVVSTKPPQTQAIAMTMTINGKPIPDDFSSP